MYKKQADTIRFLSADMIQKANSGHPGAPMGLADIMVILMKHIKHNPKNPKWLNRDRLVFSGGHASALVYSYLYLSGYDVNIEDLKNFRQLGSKTPGHPEITTPGVEIATGPLGQGIANAVGFAMSEKYAENLLNDEMSKVIGHKVFCLCGDGDLEEGISYEACSLAGSFGLDNLVIIYDCNNITIEGDIKIAFSENVKARFEAQGFEVVSIDGHNYDEINDAILKSKKQTKPLLIIAHTKIAKGAGTLEGTSASHGSPLGEEVIKKAKIEAGFDPEKKFYVPDDVLFEFRSAVEKGDLEEKIWNKNLENISESKRKLLDGLLNPDFDSIEYPDFTDKKIATRDSNGKILNAIAAKIPGFLGGSADLAPSNKTELINAGDFPVGKNLHFGIREHAMAAISNAIARYGLFIPYCATFFIFSDYLKPSARLAALMKLKHFFVFTHDSIGVGEDGPTHQPIEQLTTLRAMPNFYSFRPADGNENSKSWQIALKLDGPCAFLCSRQSLEPLPKGVFGDVNNGAYLIKKVDNPDVTLVASGSEVYLCYKAAKILEEKNIKVNVISAPCFDLLKEQSKEYINVLFDKNSKIIAVEASSAIEWYKYADFVIGMNTFGESGPANQLFEHFGFSDTKIANKVISFLN